MSAIKNCKREIQEIVDKISEEAKLTIEHGFEKMLKNSNFEKMILDLKEKVEREDSKNFMVKQSPVSILGLNSKDYGLPVAFDNFLDFMAFVYGLAKMFSISALSVTYEYDGNDSIEKSTEEFSTLDDFLVWVKRQFEFYVDIYDPFPRGNTKEYACIKFDEPINYHHCGLGRFHVWGTTISMTKTNRYGIINQMEGSINFCVPMMRYLTIIFHRIPPIRNDVKKLSWY